MNTYKDGEKRSLSRREGRRDLSTSESTYLKCKDAPRLFPALLFVARISLPLTAFSLSLFLLHPVSNIPPVTMCARREIRARVYVYVCLMYYIKLFICTPSLSYIYALPARDEYVHTHTYMYARHVNSTTVIWLARFCEIHSSFAILVTLRSAF